MKANVLDLCFGLALVVSAAVPCQAQSSVSLPYSFTGGTDGAQPNSLIQAQDGNYYGTTAYGGASCAINTGTPTGCGTIFQLSPNANGTFTLTTLYQFTGSTDGGVPTGVLQGPDGYLYGTTLIGGASLSASQACIDKNGSNNPSSTTPPYNSDYGNPKPCCVDSTDTINIGCGTIFRILPSQPPMSGQIDTLASFDGATEGAFPNPLTLGLASDGVTSVLYGSTQPASYCPASGSCGASGFLFSFTPPSGASSTGTFQLLPFADDSNLSFPNALIQGECQNGAKCDDNLYGTALLGPSSVSCPNTNADGESFGCGGVFQYNIETQKDTLLCTFPSANNTNQSETTSDSSGLAASSRKIAPETIIRQSSARFPFGVEWSFDTVPISLTEASDGSILGTTPWACFTNSDSYLLGGTCGTGASDAATVFQCQPPFTSTNSGTANTIYQFTGQSVQGGNVAGSTDGGGSLTGLTLASDGNYYGTSGNGIFEITSDEMGTFLGTQTSPPAELAALNPYVQLASGYNPNWIVQGVQQETQGTGVYFYGTTAVGGANGDGAVFSVTTTLPAPLQVTVSPAQIVLGHSTTLTGTIPNAFSLTAQQCYAFQQGNSPLGLGALQDGSVANSAYSGSVTITPSQTGSFTYAVTCGGEGSGFATLQVNPALTFPTTSLPGGVANQLYTGSVAASGGIAPYTYSLASGSLPAGLMLNSDGAITGTPTAVGASTFSITVEDSESTPASVTTPFSITVTGPPIEVTLMAQPNTGATYGQSITLTATETPVEGVAQGYSWTINEDGNPLVQGAAPTGSGTYAMNTNPTAGQHSFTATYSSSQNYYPPGTSNSVSITVDKATPSVTTWPTAGALTAGQALSNSTLTGGTASVSGAFAWTTPASIPPAGNYSGSVTFTPTDSTDYNTVSGAVTVTVNPAPGFTLSSSPASVSVAQGGDGTSTITVTAVGGFSGSVALAASGLPSGVTPTFTAGSAAGTQVLTLAASASAQVTSSPVTITITGTSGAQSAMTTISLSITPQPSFTAGSGGTTSISIVPGATTGNTATISVVGTNGFSGTVNLSCAVTTSMTNVSNVPTCSLNPLSVTISGSSTQTSTLTVSTTAASSAEKLIHRLFRPVDGTALALIVFLLVPRRRRNWLAVVGALVLFVVIGASGCGGGGTGDGGGGGGNPGTTAGSYTITVTGTSGSINETVGTVTLTVQ
jgi:hypothetical protein